MRKYPFKRKDKDSLITVPCRIGIDTIALALDTGASHTTFDLTQILMLGYSVTDAIRMERVKTGGGTVETYVFVLKQLTCLGITRTNIEVSAYDFFEDVKFCIDLKQKEINIQ